MNEERERKIHELMKGTEFEISANKYWIWFKRSGGTESGRMDVIDTKKMECYAYEEDKSVDADAPTKRLLQILRVELDKDQKKLF